MANVLKMDKQILIRQLLNLGWSYRRIHPEASGHTPRYHCQVWHESSGQNVH